MICTRATASAAIVCRRGTNHLFRIHFNTLPFNRTIMSASAAAAPAAATITQHNTKKGFNAATKNPARNPHLMHVLFIRHAESSNNVLAETITKELGINPYGPNAGAEVLAEYDKRRLCDPHLSPLGEKQAELLPRHPHFHDIKFDALVNENRVRVITSPMKRAILTSMPLMKHYKLPRATLLPDMCEKGGSYQSKRDAATGAHENIADPGLGRKALEELYGETHDASVCREDGWWHSESKGNEENDAFEIRLNRAKAWIEEAVAKYAAQPQTTPDYIVIVSHADFIDAMITKILRLQNHAKYVFYCSNTSCSHLEFEVKSGPAAAAPAAAASNSGYVVRVRGTNIKPVSIDSHELLMHHQLKDPAAANSTPAQGK